MSTSKEAKLILDIDETQAIPASPAYPIPEIVPELDKSQFVVSCNSNLRGFDIKNAFDGSDDTIWHTHWTPKPDKHPYIIDVELGGLYAVNCLKYVPRQDGESGRIAEFEVYAARSKESFGKPLYKGTFKNNKDMQAIKFATTWSKYVRIKVLSEVNGKPYGAVAEFDILQDLKAEPLADEIMYLSDMKPASVKGEYKNDKSIGGRTITVNETEYKKGIGANSGSELVYKIDGSWDRLSGHVGMDDEVGDGGSVMFRVYVDGKLLFESPSQTGKSIKQLMDLKIDGAKELRLELLDDGDGDKDDHGDWIDAKLVRKGSE